MFKRYNQEAYSIGRVILKQLNGIPAYSRVAYVDKAIEIMCDKPDKEVFIWIRLMWNQDTDKCRVDISNIELDKAIQRQGIFTNIIKELKKHKSVENISIQSVCTESMRKWCKKHRFKEDEYGANYYWKA